MKFLTYTVLLVTAALTACTYTPRLNPQTPVQYDPGIKKYYAGGPEIPLYANFGELKLTFRAAKAPGGVEMVNLYGKFWGNSRNNGFNKFAYEGERGYIHWIDTDVSCGPSGGCSVMEEFYLTLPQSAIARADTGLPGHITLMTRRHSVGYQIQPEDITNPLLRVRAAADVAEW